MRVNLHPCARQPAAVDNAGMVMGVAEDDVAAAGECGDRADVGGKPAGKHERRFGPFELGQIAVRVRHAAATGPRSSGLAPLPQPSVLQRLAHRRGEPRIGRQPEIVVRAKIDHAPAVDLDLDSLRPHVRAACGAGPSASSVGEFVVDPSERVGHRESMYHETMKLPRFNFSTAQLLLLTALVALRIALATAVYQRVRRAARPVATAWSADGKLAAMPLHRWHNSACERRRPRPLATLNTGGRFGHCGRRRRHSPSST